jgi:hypothetical protein
LAASCGDGGSGAKTPANGSTQVGSPVVVLQAATLLPKLDDLGYALAQQGKDPLAPPSVDTAQAIYLKPNSNRSIQVRIFVMGTADLARTQYRTYADQFRNPPPDVLGIPSKNVDTLSPKVGDEQKSYVTEKPDGQGNSVWTDIYRAGRVVFFLQVLDAASGDQMTLRTTVAGRIASKAK